MSPVIVALIMFCGACIAAVIFAGWLLRPLRPRPIPEAHCSVSRSRMWNAPELHPHGPWYYRPDGTIGDLRADMAPIPQPRRSTAAYPLPPPSIDEIVTEARRRAVERRRVEELKDAPVPQAHGVIAFASAHCRHCGQPCQIGRDGTALYARCLCHHSQRPEPTDLSDTQQDTARRMIEEALGE